MRIHKTYWFLLVISVLVAAISSAQVGKSIRVERIRTDTLNAAKAVPVGSIKDTLTTLRATVNLKADSADNATRSLVNALRGSDTSRAIVRESLKADSVDNATRSLMNTLRGSDTSRAIVREGLKAPLDSPTFTGTVTLPSGMSYDSVSICVAALDSSMLDYYGQDQTKLYGGYYLSKSLIVDSLIVVTVGASGDTVQVDYRYGPSYASASGGTAIWTSLTDAVSYTTGTRIGSPDNGAIPKGNFLWYRLMKNKGAIKLLAPILKGRYTR